MYLDQSITDENADRSYLSGNLAGENVVVSMTKLSFCYTVQDLEFPPPISCLKSVSQRDTAVSSQKRPKSVLDTDDPYHVACLILHNIIIGIDRISTDIIFYFVVTLLHAHLLSNHHVVTSY